MPPIYVFECESGHKFDRFLKLDEYDTPQTCECGKAAKRKIVPTMIKPDMADWEAYQSPASGKWITSYSEREADMKATGCVDYDPGMRKVQRQKEQDEDKALDAAVDDTVERAWEAMPSDKKEKLENELKYNDLSYERDTA